MKDKAFHLLLACLLLPGAAMAQVYKCTNPDGSIAYTDKACQGSKPIPATSTNPRPSDDPPPSQADIEMIRDLDNKAKIFLSDQKKRCKSGDMDACKISACVVVTSGKGPSEDFITCAKANGLPYGSHWIISSGKPRFNIQPEWQYISKLPSGTSLINHFVMSCLRKKPHSSEVESFPIQIKETMRTSHSAKGPSLDFTFSVDGKGWDRNAVSAEYRN